MDLAGSAFGDSLGESHPRHTIWCPGAELQEVERIADCPVMTEEDQLPVGYDTAEFELHLPSYDGNTDTMVILHGIGSSIEAMLGSANLLEEASRTGRIIIAPQALERGGTAAGTRSVSRLQPRHRTVR